MSFDVFQPAQPPEWRWTRRINRTVHALWPVGAALLAAAITSRAAAAATFAGPVPISGWVAAAFSGAFACFLAGVLGILPLSIQLADLSDWAQDVPLACVDSLSTASVSSARSVRALREAASISSTSANVENHSS